MKLRLAIATAFLFSGASAAMAAPFGQPRAPVAQLQQQEGPAKVLRRGLGKLITFMSQQERPSEAQIQAFLDRDVAPYFDFSYMSRWVAGKRYRTMSAEQRTQMTNSLQRRFLGALAQKLGKYQNQRVRILRPRRGQGNEVTVGVGILQPGGYPSKLDFRFYRGDDGWKVFDVAANRSSALLYYRQQFNRDRRQYRQTGWGRRP